MPKFAQAPLVVREGLLFPYLAGADFMRWFRETYPDTVPFGPRLPTSSEQVLYPDRYRLGDEPVTLRFQASPAAGTAVYEDTWGQFDEERLRLSAENMERAGDLAQAKQIWMEIAERFPGSEAAEEARSRIDTTPPALQVAASPSVLWHRTTGSSRSRCRWKSR